MPGMLLMFGSWVKNNSPMLILAFVAFIAGIRWAEYGFTKKEREYSAQITKMVLEQKELSNKKNIEYIEKEKIIYEKGQTITKKIPVYITKQDDEACIIADGAVLLHNDAAVGTERATSDIESIKKAP